MKISELIKKGALTKAATMTAATIATTTPKTHANIAGVATVAVIDNNEMLSSAEEQKILAWLKHIEEEDVIIINEVIEICRNNLTSRQYFLKRAEEVPVI